MTWFIHVSPKAKGYRNRAIVILLRFKVTTELNSRILAMNSRVQRLCREAGVRYDDMFTLFQDNPNLFTSNGLHLSNQGKQLYAKALKVNINKFNT